MANCNGLFGQFNKEIKLDSDRRVVLREKRNDLRKRVQNGFDVVKNLEKLNHELEFQSQGSYVMDTIINPCDEEDQYDLDDGIYFIGNLLRPNRPQPQTFHNWIIKSIESGESDNEITEIKDKNTCVRVIYKGRNGDLNYHIDLPIYYASNVETPDLADKKEWWHLSNPVEFIIWFENKVNSGFKKEYILESKLYSDEYDKWLNDVRKKDHQLRRVVRYMKAWGDFKKGDMPPGIVMTILAGLNYNENERDDVCLKNTLENIRDYLIGNGFKCIRPTTPSGEDLFKDYSETKKEYFKNALNSFIQSANDALCSKNQKEASDKWKIHLGDRFPEGQDIDINEKETDLKAIRDVVLGGKAFTQSDGRITMDDSGIKNKKHRNFGG